MQIEAIYNRGQLQFARPVKLRRDYLRLIVEIPENELMPTTQASDDTVPATKTRDRLNAILGQWRQSDAADNMDYKAIWYAHLEDKYLGNR